MVSALNSRLPGRIYEMRVIGGVLNKLFLLLVNSFIYYISCLVLASSTQMHNRNPFMLAYSHCPYKLSPTQNYPAEQCG